MRIRIELTNGIVAFAGSDKKGSESIVAQFIELELPSRQTPLGLETILADVVGREFSDMAMDAVYKLAALAALKEVIR